MDKIALSLAVAASIIFSGFLFNHNLPNWCANPNAGGNLVVQPLCK